MFPDNRKDIPDGVWVKCSECGEIIYNGELSRNLRICPRCDYYFPLDPAERIAILADKRSIIQYNSDKIAALPDREVYERAVITGEATLSSRRLVIATVNLGFADSSIGLLVCEKIIGAVTQATDKHLPLLLICTNGPGSHLRNGTFFPAQTLSISAAMSGLAKERLLYISVLAHPNSHNHFPGFACIADIVIAESNMPRASRTGGQVYRNGTDRAARDLFESGMVDMIVSRRNLRHTLVDILKFLS